MPTASPTLSPREWQVLALVAQGLPNKEIAQQLTISAHTVEKHLTHLYKKLNVTNRLGAGQWYWQNETIDFSTVSNS